MIDIFLLIFCFLYLILPDYLAIEFSGSLPLLTAARILIVLLFVVSFVHVWKQGKLRVIKDKRLWICIGAYFGFRLIANLYYITVYSTAINNLFKMIAEQLSLLILLPNLIDTDEKREKTLKTLVYASALMALFGIAESLSGWRVFDLLYTVDRKMLNHHFTRLGLLRAVTSFGLSNLFAFYLNMMTPFTFYLCGKTGQKRYIVIGALNFLALIFTGCRGNLFAFGAIVLMYLIFTKERLRFVKRFLAGAGIVLALVLIMRFSNARLQYYFDGTAKSLLNVVGFDFDLDEGAPDESSGFGGNADGSASRLAQFSMITYVMGKKPLFGMGAGAQARADVPYYWQGKWRKITSYDVGYVAMLCDEGIIGTLGYMALFIGVMIIYIQECVREKDDERKRELKIFIQANILFFICLLFAIQMMQMYFLINAIGLSSLKSRVVSIRKTEEQEQSGSSSAGSLT